MVKDISAKDAFAALQGDSNAVLLDVRTQPELTFSGMPSMPNHRHISLTKFPQRTQPNFMAEVQAQISKDQPVYCLCKGGGRSAAAAKALSAAGYGEVYNILSGFDGDQNPAGQRRSVNGWAADGLPWHQA